MGLDMYLSKRSYVKNWEHYPNRKHEVSVKLNGNKRKDIKPSRVSYVMEELLYWRKANHIHKWFVDTLADGVDECQDISVDLGDLKTLRDLCRDVVEILDGQQMTKEIQYLKGWSDGNEVYGTMYVYDDELTEKVMQLLPTQSGFFFGGVSIDEYYFEQTKRTLNELNQIILEHPDDVNSGVYYVYSASW